MQRLTIVLCVLGLSGIAAAASVPLVVYVRTQRAHNAAAGMLTSVGVAQAAFRAASGHGGYATDLATLTTACPPSPPSSSGGFGGASPPDSRAPALDPSIGRAGGNSTYSLVLRAAREATPRGVDCFGRTTVSEYYAAAAPRRNGTDGRLAMALRRTGRIFVFFDGRPPLESDMAAGGLAVPLDTLEAFRAP